MAKLMPIGTSRDAIDSENVASFLARVHPVDWKNPTARARYDLAILGAGPAGVEAAESAVRLGKSVALVERDRIGGTSLNQGSIPSKAIIRSARALMSVRDSDEYGTALQRHPRSDFAAMMARMHRIRTRVAEYHSVKRLQGMGVDVFFGDARFAGPDAIVLGDTRIAFEFALIATGARPKSSDIPGLADVGYRTSESIFQVTELPARLGVIGGGPLGCEIAQAFCQLGSHVILMQNAPKFLPAEGRDAAELLSMSLSRDGVETRLNTAVVGARREGSGKILDTTNDERKESIAVDEVLLSIGRSPNVENLELAAAGVEFDCSEGVKVDQFLCTSNPRVYSAGDVCNEQKFTNAAKASGHLAVQNAMAGQRLPHTRLYIPWCTYCDPEVAHIGLHPSEARERSIVIKSYTVMMQDVDRAITDGQDSGFVKIHVAHPTDRIVGATIVGVRASELINEMAVIMSAGMGMRELANVLHTYPARSDSIRLAALAFVQNQGPAPT